MTEFESGTMEFVSIIRKKSEKYLRFMRPLITEKGCLRCHAAQGYKVGDIRGGISISVPMTPFYAVAQKTNSHSGYRTLLSFIDWTGIYWSCSKLFSKTDKKTDKN